MNNEAIKAKIQKKEVDKSQTFFLQKSNKKVQNDDIIRHSASPEPITSNFFQNIENKTEKLYMAEKLEDDLPELIKCEMNTHFCNEESKTHIRENVKECNLVTFEQVEKKTINGDINTSTDLSDNGGNNLMKQLLDIQIQLIKLSQLPSTIQNAIDDIARKIFILLPELYDEVSKTKTSRSTDDVPLEELCSITKNSDNPATIRNCALERRSADDCNSFGEEPINKSPIKQDVETGQVI